MAAGAGMERVKGIIAEQTGGDSFRVMEPFLRWDTHDTGVAPRAAGRCGKNIKHKCTSVKDTTPKMPMPVQYVNNGRKCNTTYQVC
jgi:hypothetical protein